jgi:DNA invertase Pin-like site-specific DNA recombinase
MRPTQPPQNRTCRFPRIRLRHPPADISSSAETVRDGSASGNDPIDTRPCFTALLDRIEENGVRTVLIEDASRFARDLIVQELGVVLMIQRGVRVLTASGEDLTETDDPARVMMRQVAAACAQYEKERLVRKLRAARERKRANFCPTSPRMS